MLCPTHKIPDRLARVVIFANGWEFSNGCAYEFLISTKAGIERLDESWCPIDSRSGLSSLRSAIDELSSRALPAEFLRGIVDDLASLSGGPDFDVVNEGLQDAITFKDAGLDSLANHGNVAQFVSFSPSLDIRYSRIAGYAPNAAFDGARRAIAAVLSASDEHSVNVRSYHPDHPKSREFIYGLRDEDSVEAALRRLANDGLFTIVNETVDINDGGISGVALSDVIEFAPCETPRCVEKPGTVSVPRNVGLGSAPGGSRPRSAGGQS